MAKKKRMTAEQLESMGFTPVEDDIEEGRRLMADELEAKGFVASDIDFSPETQKSQALMMAQDVGEFMDVPGSVTREGVYALQEGKEPFSPMIGRVGEILDEGVSATTGAPTGRMISKKAGWDSPVGGFFADLLLDPSLIPAGLLSKITKRVTKPLGVKLGEGMASKSVADNITKSKYNLGYDPDALGTRIMEDELAEYLTDPEELLNRIAGTTKIHSSGPEGYKVIKSVSNENGLIKGVSDQISEQLALNVDNVGKISPNRLIDRMVKAKEKEMKLITGGQKLDKNVLAKYQEEIQNRLIKPSDDMAEQFELELNVKDDIRPKFIDAAFAVNEGTPLNVVDLHELRKNINKQINEFDIYATADKSVRLEKQALMDMSKEIGNAITSMTKGIKLKNGLDLSEFMTAQNNRLHHYIQLRSMLQDTPLDELKKLDLSQVATKMGALSAIGFGGGLAADIIGMGNNIATYGLATGLAGGAVSSAEQIAKSVPRVGAKAVEKIFTKGPRVPFTQKHLPQLASPFYAPQTFRQFTDREYSPVEEKQAYAPQTEEEQIEMASIPRNFDDAWEKKHLVFKILERMAPQIAQGWRRAIYNDDKNMAKKAHELAGSTYHEAMEYDDYNHVNGIVAHPEDQAKVLKDIERKFKDDPMRRILLIDNFNKTRKIPEELK